MARDHHKTFKCHVTLNLSEGRPAEEKPRAEDATLGERLRRAREARGLTLHDISNETRISVRNLEAIERNDFKKLPGGIFNRSFVRAYARVVGFDEHEAVELYLRAAREQGIPLDDVPPLRSSTVYTDGQTSSSSWPTIILSIVVLAILSLGIYAALHWYQRRTAAHTAPEALPTPTPAASLAGQTGPPPAAAFRVEIRTKNEQVWIRARADDGEAAEAILRPNESKEFQPERRLQIEFSRSKLGAFEVLVNGRPTQIQPTIEKGLAQLVIVRPESSP